MKILAHRGFWQDKAEQNTLSAFKKAYENGFGIEYDVRDLNGDLVISHDMPKTGALRFSEFCEHYKHFGKNNLLATNIKADGLQTLIKKYFEEYGITNYFLFDMAVPDGIIYHKRGFNNLFTRHSQYEKEPSFYEISSGVWMDEFNGEQWITDKIINHHLQNNKKISIVSPELHDINYYLEKKKSNDLSELKNRWKEFLEFKDLEDFYLCTDFPDIAKEFFS